ncbi:MAG: hypothetical protein GF418_04845 [Chitinivibrionales bacterium]|nr:hypothetical protein [Chitinivibrionales bacterium]MBD3394937.1 hypothetical protein [Chitinivibrionales bacterium]
MVYVRRSGRPAGRTARQLANFPALFGHSIYRYRALAHLCRREIFMKPTHIIVVLVLLTAAHSGTITVSPGDDLDAKIESAQGGDVVLISPGTYGPVSITNKQHSASSYVLVKKNGAGTVTAKAPAITTGSALFMENCSYYVFEDTRFEGGMWGMRIRLSDHMIFKSIEVTATGQEGVHFENAVSYIDMLDCKIWDTGNYNAKWGECIYLGSAANKAWWPDYTHHIWMEDCDLSDCGNGEAVDFKGEVDASTLRNSVIYDIAPGTSDQHNEGAIVLQAIEVSGLERRDNFVEGCEVYNVSGGRFNRGITFMGAGNTIRNNTIYNCAAEGLAGNTWKDAGKTTYVYNNTITNCNPNTDIPGSMTVSNEDNDNPYSPQSWYDAVSVDGALRHRIAPDHRREVRASSYGLDGRRVPQSRQNATAGVFIEVIEHNGAAVATKRLRTR